jgi:hypothetical protein
MIRFSYSNEDNKYEEPEGFRGRDPAGSLHVGWGSIPILSQSTDESLMFHISL